MPTNIINVGYKSTNYWLVATGAAWLLVDCGWPGTMGQLKHQLARKGVDFNKVRQLLVTHYHPDHAGLTQELRNAGVALIMMDTQVAGAAQLKQIMKPESGYVEIVLGDLHPIAIADSRELLKRDGLDGQIIPTPGHSPDSVSLILDEGIAFTGDLTHHLLIGPEEVECQASWRAAYDLGVHTICPAHGRTYPRPNTGQ
jgi:endoribonuclease LACTB2